MTLSPGSTLYDANGSSYRLAREIGRGAEGAVWSMEGHGDRLAKLYLRGMDNARVAKITTMCRLRSEALNNISAWPISLLMSSRGGKPAGLLMRKVTDSQPIHNLYGIKSRLRTFPEAQLPFLIHVATNTARAFATIHSAGQVVGDVNHSNLMVARNGTVAMIDCDSFQITDGQSVYHCEVGVPEFTPPELQGTSFRQITRTAQHDIFGLSVLLFYLLFLGRHPFMGVYNRASDEILSLDQAIGQYKFPYMFGLTSSDVRLPSFIPRLNDYPAELGQLFVRTFTREAISKGRPAAAEWVTALARLSQGLKSCAINPNHHFFAGLTACPWCRMEGVLGTPIFGIRVAVVSAHGFNLAAIWAEIETIKPIPEPLNKPDLTSIRTKYSPDQTIPAIARNRRMCRLASILIVAIISIGAVAAFPGFLAFLAIVFSLIFGGNLWSKGNKGATPFIGNYNSALKSYRNAEMEFDRSIAPPPAFVKARSELETYKKNFEGLGGEKSRRLAELNATREAKQRQHFLERFRIEDESIPFIGPKSKMILYTWGILDASDIDGNRIDAIKGFGTVKVQALVEWRRSKEKLFRFDAKKPVDPRDLKALEQEFAQKTQTLENALRQGPLNLRQALAVWQVQRRQQMARLFTLAEELGQAEVNRNALGKL